MPPFGFFVPSIMLLVLVYAFVLALTSFPFVYVILRMRDLKGEKPDPQLGLKAAMYFFFSIGILLFLSGLNLLVVDLLVTENRPRGQGLSPLQRFSLALMIAGFVIALLHLVLVKSMTSDRNPATRRMFTGWRALIHGIIVMSLLTVLLVIYFQENFMGVSNADRKSLWGSLLVWFPSWTLHLVLLWFYSRPLYQPSRNPDRSDWDR